MRYESDLVVLTPTRSESFFLQGLQEGLGLRPRRPQWEIHPLRDTGCLEADELLCLQVERAEHALVIANRERIGHAERARESLEASIEARLEYAGWGNRARVVIIDPGIEKWLLAHQLGARFEPGMDLVKTVDFRLRQRHQPGSPELYRRLGERMAHVQESDPAWLKLVSTLKEWLDPRAPATEPEYDELDLSSLPDVQAHHKQAEALRREWESRIGMDPALCGGKPHIRGHRIWVSMILSLLASGWTLQQVLENYPGLTEADIRACLAFGGKAVEQLYPGP